MKQTPSMLQEHKIARCCNLCKNGFSKAIWTKNGFHLLECSSCGLVYVGNPPSKLELEKLYSFDSGYKIGFRDDPDKFKHELIFANRYYELIEKYKKRGRLLDIGCAVGSFLKVAEENGWETHGVEISKDLADIARKRYGLKVLTGRLDENSFRPNYFDAVTMWDLIEHVEDPMKTMSIINRILKDDGIVGISTPNIDGLFPRLSYTISPMIGYWPHPEPPYHLFQFSKKTIYKLLELTGFNLSEIYDRRISIVYSFGRFKNLIMSPKRFLYSAFFIPIALLGPIVHSGDWITVIAKKARASEISNGKPGQESQHREHGYVETDRDDEHDGDGFHARFLAGFAKVFFSQGIAKLVKKENKKGGDYARHPPIQLNNYIRIFSA